MAARDHHDTILLVLYLLHLNTLLTTSHGARILIMTSTPSISHSVIYHPIIRELAQRGHQVVAIVTDPLNDPTLHNLTEIDVHDCSYAFWRAINQFALAKATNLPHIIHEFRAANILMEIADVQLSQPDVKRLINDPEQHFDVVLTEWLSFASTAAFGHHFNCPVIGISSYGLFLSGNDDVGNPTHPLYSLDAWQPSIDAAVFSHRVRSTIHAILMRICYRYILQPRQDAIARKHFGDDIPYIGDLERKVSLILQNTNPFFHKLGPKVPAIIEYGGIHKRNRKPLPQDLQTYLDEANNGCIYFSLGSNIKSEIFPAEQIEILLATFRKLPYNILWKVDATQIKNIPPNIKTMTWLPQQDILDHKNVRLFIMQGGLQSTEEAISSGVPLLAIPFFADQEQNAQRYERLGIGKRVELSGLTVEELQTVIEEMMGNKSYSENMKALSKVLWDTPMKPLDTAIWWIEYVIRHRGAEALRSPTADIPWYQYHLLDVFCFFLLCFFLIIGLAYKILILIKCKVFPSKVRTRNAKSKTS